MYYVAKISQKEVTGGVLSRIVDALDTAFAETFKAVTYDGKRGTPEELASYFTRDEHDLVDAYYFNSAAKAVLEHADVKLSYEATTLDVQPPEAREFYRIVHYINLH